MVVTTVLAKVDPKRLAKGAEGLASGTYEITVTRQSEEEVRGIVRNGDGVEYGVTITTTLTTCSCKDALYRGTICKHSAALALYVIRNPQEKPLEGERKPNLKLAKVRSEAEREQVRREIEELYGVAA